MIAELRLLMEFYLTPPNDEFMDSHDIILDLGAELNKFPPITREMLHKLAFGESLENLLLVYGKRNLDAMYAAGNSLLIFTKDYLGYKNGKRV